MQRSFDAGAVVGAEIADAGDDHLQVFGGDLGIAEVDLSVPKARFRQATQIHHDFNEVGSAVGFLQGKLDAFRQDCEQQLQIVRDLERGSAGHVVTRHIIACTMLLRGPACTFWNVLSDS